MVRAAGVDGDTPAIHAGEGGSNPTAALFRKADWRVDTVCVRVARRLVRLHHYSRGGSNRAVLCSGLFPANWVWEEQCVGVAWWIPPTKTAGGSINPDNPQGVLSLTRLVVVPGVPKNACSFLIRHSMRFIDRARWPVLVTYADEWQEHNGTIYEAAGWTFDGYSKPEKRYTKNGRMVSRKAGPKTRTHAEMLATGCECIGSFRCKRFIHRLDPS